MMIVDELTLKNGVALAAQHWQISAVLALVAIPLCTFAITSLISWVALLRKKAGNEPPLNPYWLPILGDWFSFLLARKSLVNRVYRRFGDKTPVTIKLGPSKAYLLTQPEMYGPLLKDTRSCTNKAFAVLIYEQLFGTPKSAMHIYRDDKSGIGSTPVAGSTVPDHLRVWHHQHRTAARFLQGESLKQLGIRVIEHLSADLAKSDQNDPIDSGEWVDVPDFYVWWTHRLFAAAITALCGPHLVSLNPGFVDHFWEYMESWPTISKFYPRLLAPKAYAARQRILDAIKRWHAHAREHSDYRDNGPDAPAWDEHWGSAWLKVRQQWGQDTGSMDDDALASEDLALITAASANALPMAFWILIEVFSDTELLSRVQREIQNAIPDHGGASGDATPQSSLPFKFDITAITGSPLLQSVYAEVLRMRVSLMHNRSPIRGDYNLGPYKLRQGGLVCVSTDIASNHTGVWGEARTAQPLSQFWAERFLVADGEKKVKFSTDGLEGAWMPYGGGSLMCPGRHLAKQEMMGGVAVFGAYFDMQVLNGPPRVDDRFYGLGAQPPGEPVAVRLRRRVGIVS
ncbi:cytochrome P450 [Astrocystis sublimbata]|nr:cytochrome P450 [Astrocystis sublimbata]